MKPPGRRQEEEDEDQTGAGSRMLSRHTYMTLEPTQSYLLVKIALGQCLGDTKTKRSEVHVGC